MVHEESRQDPQLAPYSWAELHGVFCKERGSINKHLPTIYSIVVGLNAQRVLEIGAGSTTRTIRSALQLTGGSLVSIDMDPRFKKLEQTPHQGFRFLVGTSCECLTKVDPPFDFILHDGAHDYCQVKWDLQHLLPMVKKYGILCVHDTQHSQLGDGMTRAITDATLNHSVSWVHMPYCYGLTILRMEESRHPEISTPWRGRHGAGTTHCISSPMKPASTTVSKPFGRGAAWARWMLRRVRRKMISDEVFQRICHRIRARR